MADLTQSVQEDVTRLGEDIAALDLDVTDLALTEETREDYTRALDSYDAAKKATEQARPPEDMTGVTKANRGQRSARRSGPKIWTLVASASSWLSVCPVTSGCALTQAVALAEVVKKLM